MNSRFSPFNVTLLIAALAVPCTTTAAEETAKPWSAKANLSYVRSTGNSDNETFAGSAEFQADYSPQRVMAKAGYLTTKSEGDTTAKRGTAEGRYEYLFSDRMFGFVAADYLRDRFAGYDHRITGGPGVGYDFIRTDAHLLKGLASLQYTYSDFTEGGTDTYLSGKAAAEYTWKINEQAVFRQLLDHQMSFEDTNVYFINSDSKLEYSLNAYLAAAVQYQIHYANEPPEGAEKTDRIFLASLVVKY